MKVIKIRGDLYLEDFEDGDISINNESDTILINKDEIKKLIEELQKLI